MESKPFVSKSAPVHMHRTMCMGVWQAYFTHGSILYPRRALNGNLVIMHGALGLKEACLGMIHQCQPRHVGCYTRFGVHMLIALVNAKRQEYMVPWLGGSIPESTHDKYWESAFYNRLLVRVLFSYQGRRCCMLPGLLKHRSWTHMTALLLQNWDREAAEDQPIIVNPLRHSIPPQFRNGEKLVCMQLSGISGA